MKRELVDSEMYESIPTQIFGSTSKRVNAWSSIHPYYFLEPNCDFQGAVHTLTYTRKGINMYVADCSAFCVVSQFVVSRTHGFTEWKYLNVALIQTKAFAYIAPQPRVQLVEQEPRLFSSPVDEVIVSIDENVVEAAAEPDGIALEGRLLDWRNEADKIKA